MQCQKVEPGDLVLVKQKGSSGNYKIDDKHLGIESFQGVGTNEKPQRKAYSFLQTGRSSKARCSMLENTTS